MSTTAAVSLSKVTRVILVVAVVAGSTSAGLTILKREIPHHIESDYHGGSSFNSVSDLGHFPAFKLPIPPAYSTISYVQTHHDKPVSYSGFTNHGRGHHDPGYAIEYRSEGFIPDHHHHHHHHPHHYY